MGHQVVLPRESIRLVGSRSLFFAAPRLSLDRESQVGTPNRGSAHFIKTI